MKKQIKTLLLVVLLIGYALPLWAQASTEGKEFWVALNITTGTGGTDHKPFIYITTQHQGGRYTITNPADATIAPITGLIPATGYVKITIPGDNTGTANLDLNRWYPVGLTAPAASNQIKNVGLKIETTVDCSVYAANSLPQSFDAANILPVTALQMDYITQDYPGYDHGGTGTGDGGFPEITILATENNTQVKINPSSAVLNSNGTALITKTLNAGQVLYITGENRATLSGSVITSDKKIAVFTGVNNTDVPGPKSARDHLYEQNMPIDYWGTHFIVTRSMKKDANRIRVTAKENGTSIFVDGYEIATINSGKTYEFELCSPEMRTQGVYSDTDPTKGAVGAGRGTEYFFDGPAHYLETSCPCAVFSYDVSENYYISNGTSERDPNAHGDPAMVWISPLEQQLRKVTFGVMNTDNTTAHYVNIITPTEGASSLEVREVGTNAGQVVYGNNMVNPADIQPVPSNPAYSYARVKLVEDAEKTYTITSDIGFIAHVYGSGDKESYAYSCGSAAVQQGVKVNGTTFINGYRSDSKFCMGNEFTFDAKVGTDEITRVDWDFGDGTTQYNGEPVTTHKYNNPGWYDATAKLYGRQACANVSEQDLGSISFTFRVWQAGTQIGSVKHQCIEPDSTLIKDDGSKVKLTAEEVEKLLLYGEQKIDTPLNCIDDTIISYLTYGIKTQLPMDTISGQDSVVYNDSTYRDNTTIVDTLTNDYNCEHFVPHFIKVKKCLAITMDKSAEKCPGENIVLSYKKTKGDIKNPVHLVIAGGILDTTFVMSNENTDDGELYVPTSRIKKPGYYHATLTIPDANDCVHDPYPIDVTINYPETVFDFLYTNVLAVRKDLGYNFTHYQWYLNDKPVGEDVSILYLGEDVTIKDGEDQAYVILTDQSGMVLKSCTQTLTYKEGQLRPNKTPANKILKNQRLYIIRDEQVYDIYGQKVK